MYNYIVTYIYIYMCVFLQKYFTDTFFEYNVYIYMFLQKYFTDTFFEYNVYIYIFFSIGICMYSIDI